MLKIDRSDSYIEYRLEYDEGYGYAPYSEVYNTEAELRSAFEKAQFWRAPGSQKMYKRSVMVFNEEIRPE